MASMLLALALVLGTWAPRMVEEDTQPPPLKGRDSAPWPSVLQEVLSHAKELSAALAKMGSKPPKSIATHEELLSMEMAEPKSSHKQPLPKGLQDVLSQAKRISEVLEAELQAHLPSNDTQTVETAPSESSPAQAVDRAAWHNDTTTLLARVKELSAVLADAHSQHLNPPTEEGVKHLDNDALLGRAHELSAVLAKASWHSLANHSSANHSSANHSTVGVVSLDSDPTAVMEAEETETGTLLKRAKQLTEVLGGPVHRRHPKVRLLPPAADMVSHGRLDS